MCCIVWFRTEKYTKTRIITECVCTKKREMGVGMGASNVLSQTKGEKIFFKTDETDLGYVLLMASNSHSNVHKKFKENKIPIHKK